MKEVMLSKCEVIAEAIVSGMVYHKGEVEYRATESEYTVAEIVEGGEFKGEFYNVYEIVIELYKHYEKLSYDLLVEDYQYARKYKYRVI